MKRAHGAEGAPAGGAGEVGALVDCSQADDRRLIALVRARRLLYARNNMPVASYYTQVKSLWEEVAREMGWSVADVRRKWSHIRNSYSRHLRNELHGACTSRGRQVSRWYLADELAFLRDHMATDTRPSYYAPSLLEVDMDAPAAVDVKPFLSSPWFAPAPEPERPPSPDDSRSSCSAFASDETSPYFQFFRGIYPDYRELPAPRQRQFKRRCLGLLHDLLDAEEAQRAGAPAGGVAGGAPAAGALDLSPRDDDLPEAKPPAYLHPATISRPPLRDE
ncbi:uncharacterized protein LOC121735222 [Aricia agestis]|uniref:uncharacterized protein LOC121735222 n=1 Tax=Aricia agestis TaxID=91739 RepID=UPI001C20318A|nr:uncharacterized protein LOC121735222 [Aricia agestis]